MIDEFVGSSLDDAARFGKLSPDAHEVGVDVASGLAAFVYTPGCDVSKGTKQNKISTIMRQTYQTMSD